MKWLGGRGGFGALGLIGVLGPGRGRRDGGGRGRRGCAVRGGWVGGFKFPNTDKMAGSGSH